MSIINDALKKAQLRKEETKKSQEAPVYKAAPEIRATQENGQFKAAAKVEKKEIASIMWIIFLIVFAGAAVWFFFSRAPEPKDVQPPVAPAQSQVVPAATKPAPVRSRGIPQFTLNGIVYDEERPYAIVNNEILT
ncbi:MAG: hypothetical protein NTV07_03195, partial [Candidatus Omnitrophica bacterium]|nr:hypothetical protein [Candidatus Omnitrophota bacterium]